MKIKIFNEPHLCPNNEKVDKLKSYFQLISTTHYKFLVTKQNITDLYN